LDELLDRETQSWAFIDEPSDDTVKPLCSAGVDWIWVAQPRTATTAWEPWGETVLVTADVAVVRINPGTCAAAMDTVGS